MYRTNTIVSFGALRASLHGCYVFPDTTPAYNDITYGSMPTCRRCSAAISRRDRSSSRPSRDEEILLLVGGRRVLDDFSHRLGMRDHHDM